jgi:ATP-binding cassette subfamily C protein
VREYCSGFYKRGGIAVVIAHRPSALAAVNMVGVIENGKLAAFGPKDEVLSHVLKSQTGLVQQIPRPAA